MKIARLLCAVLWLAGVSALMADTAETISFLTQMLPANETPPITDTSTGSVIISVHVIRDSSGAITSGSVDFSVNCKFSGAVTVTGLHIHNGPAGVAGNIVIPTDVNSSDKSIAVDATGKTLVNKQVQFPATGVNLSTITDLLQNPQNFYANIHTTDHPGGAMRGQLLRAEGRILMGIMSPKNETPPVDSNDFGIATVTALRAQDDSGKTVLANVIFNVVYTVDVGAVFTGLHIHNGAAGIPGPVIINTGIGSGAASVPADASGSGTLHYEVPIAPSDSSYTAEIATVDGIFTHPNDFYINAHTTVFPGGVIRDQLRVTDRNVFQVNLLPSNETPPIVGLNANAISDVPVYTLRDASGTVVAGTVNFDMNFRGFPAATTITGLHIHNGASTVAGPIVIPTNVGSGAASITTDTGNGNVFRSVTVATSAGLAALNQLVQTPSAFYANLHTTVNPGGAIRSQLTSVAGKPVAAGVAATSSTVLTAAPGSIVSIYGTDLAAVTTELGAFPALAALPTSMNGVTVTVAAAKAPLYFVSPGQINAQVPFEVNAGSQPLVVTTAAGASAAMNITVAAAAPSIFIVDQAAGLGAVVKNADFSLITADNPVKVGDTIVIFSTGLGQTTPAVQTGVLVVPPSGGFNNTGAVSVTMGGQDAKIVYSIASPAFAGLYQTAVTVPSGVSGKVALVLKMGSGAAASSNSVNVAVQ